MARVRLFTAVSRTTLSWRIISTVLVPLFGQRRGLAGQHGTGGALGIERVALAVLVPQLPVRAGSPRRRCALAPRRARERPAP